MTEQQKQRAFEREQRERLRSQTALIRNTQTEIDRLMKIAQARVREILAAQPTDYERWQLPQVEQEISRALATFRGQATDVADRASREAWDAGTGLIDGPLERAGVRVAAVAPLITQDQLQALRSFLTFKLREVTVEAVNLINAQLSLVTIGAQDPFKATQAIAGILDERSLRRATTIVRTELGRAFSVSSQARMTQAARAGVPMDKVWRRSGKLHQRVNHALADGQRVAYDEPFVIAGAKGGTVSLMYPRDPKAPPEETINCGCVMIPKVRGWNTATPDAAPFTDRELAANPELKQIVAKRAKK